jgi:hypothetical protein
MHTQTEPKFTLRQAHVAHRLGVSEERVREKRPELAKGEHWTQKGNLILYSAAAVTRLAELFEVPKMPTIKGPLMLEWKEHKLVVVRTWQNPIFVAGRLWDGKESGQTGFAAVPEEGPLMRVRVKTNVNLVRGMILRCIHLGADLYEALEIPRRKGRW